MKNNFTLLIALLVSVFLSCKKSELDNSSTITYGSSFGMCVGYCNNSLTIKSNSAILSRNKNSAVNSDSKKCDKVLDDEIVSALKKSIDLKEFNSLKDVYGCPDCADGGAEWIEIKDGGNVKKVTFEYGKAPAILKNAVEQLRAISTTFVDCK